MEDPALIAMVKFQPSEDKKWLEITMHGPGGDTILLGKVKAFIGLNKQANELLIEAVNVAVRGAFKNVDGGVVVKEMTIKGGAKH
jgi:hypothetical protein